ncbi:MAG TPA: hypothetical protein VE891_12850 [Allosphingosinicella sp.]|nr:hypothetical protein [Allosphingosinicella sp.]
MHDPLLFTSGSLFTLDYLVEAIAASEEYRAVDAADLRARLERIAEAFPQAHRPNESQTEDDFIWPVLGALGWSESLRQQNLTVTGREDVPDGLLFSDAQAKAAANAEAEEWKRYGHGLAAVESKRWARPLDRASGRDEATAPSTQMLRYLRRIDDLTHGSLRWGILTNGAKWRLYWAGARSVSEEFLEIDLGRVLGLGEGDDLFASEAESDHWLRVFAIMFARASFVREGPERRSFHERARAAAAFYEERVAASLSGLVFGRIFPSLASSIAGAAPRAPLEQVREAALVLLYRLLFLLYAEDRSLLPVNDRRYDDYALRPLREDVAARISRGDTFSSSAAPIWNRITDLSRIIDRGDASVGIPPYNGGLFAAGAAGGLLDAVRLSDSVMAPALDWLSHERSGDQAHYINYRDLSVQQLGSIYERLLEFELAREESGALEVRPNLFARKNTGSYYTPDALVGLILDETLEPLIAERLEAFGTSLSGLSQRDTEDHRRRLLRETDPANAILSLRVCDPAMGSGHFLVSLVDILSDHVLDAMAEAAALAADLDYVSPLAEKIEDIRATILRNARANGWAIDEAHLDDRHIVRRIVLKRCVYGVDKNPMAVELAKVALWLHTFTVGAPLSFIDHHLRSGDSLFGLWVGDAIDKASALGGELLWNEALQNAQRQARAMKTIEMATDAEIAEAHRSAEMWTDVEFQTGPLDSFVSFMHALDWLNLSRAEKGLVRVWLDGQFGDPLPISRGKARPEPIRAKAEEAEAFAAIWERARALIAEERFLNWQIAFPGVWDNWAGAGRQGGFDAVVGNPPWDRIKLQQVEWFAARRPEIARAQRASDRARMIAGLKTAGDPLFADYEKADARAADTARIARTCGDYPLLSRGDINLYSLFVERAHALVKPRGMVGLLTPSGIAGDLSTSTFFRQIATESRLKALYDFENQGRFFPDVHNSFKFCILSSSPERRFTESKCAFYLTDIRELEDPNRAFGLTAQDFARVNPNTGTPPVFRSRRDAELVSGVYRRVPVLAEHLDGKVERQWPVRYATLFHMANDSGSFLRTDELQRHGAWPTSGGGWQGADESYVPLLQGRVVGIYDHRQAGIGFNPDNIRRGFVSIPTTEEQRFDPAFTPRTEFFVARSALPGWMHEAVIVYRRSTATTNARTMVSAIGPKVGYGDSIFLIVGDEALSAGENARTISLLQANLASVSLDFIARNKVQGQNFSWYIVEQLPIIEAADYSRMFGSGTAADIVREAVLELTYTAHDMAPFARDMGYVDETGGVRPPFRWDEERRLKLRSKLDALYFILYGIYDPAEPERSREDIAYIYSTFPIVEREEQSKYGRFRSRDLCLAWINALSAGRADAEVEG